MPMAFASVLTREGLESELCVTSSWLPWARAPSILLESSWAWMDPVTAAELRATRATPIRASTTSTTATVLARNTTESGSAGAAVRGPVPGTTWMRGARSTARS